MSRQSKFLSLVLRHKPDEIGITLDRAGWVRIDQLLRALKGAGRGMSRSELDALVVKNDKRRFTVSSDAAFIRAAQGHSIAVDLGLQSGAPPSILYHGTARQYLNSIFSGGLRPIKRQQVHLSLDPATAIEVGRRHGKPVVLQVAASNMHREGHEFFRADNGVWLTDDVPAGHLSFWSSAD